MQSDNSVINEVTFWLRQVVIGLNLCPFAAKPTNENRVRMVVSNAMDDDSLLQTLESEMTLMDTKPASEIETTLVIIPDHLKDFYDYNQFLQWAQRLIKRNDWLGVYQLASFHPDYCFAGAEPDDPENLTNRSPYPIVHIIREASLEKALDYFPDVESVPERNMGRVRKLSDKKKRLLFPFLFK